MAVYFIQAGEGGLVKIGYAENVASRMTKMQSDNHERLRLLAAFDAGRSEEAELHARFAEFRQKGEWFDASVADAIPEVGLPRVTDDRLGCHLPKAPANMKEVLRARGLSQRDLAKSLNVSVSLVSRWCSRSMDVPTRHLAAVASFVNAPVEYVLALAIATPAEAAA